jgi:hypothetical protein
MLDALEARYGIPVAELESRYTLEQIELKYHFLGRARVRRDMAEKNITKIAVSEAIVSALKGL